MIEKRQNLEIRTQFNQAYDDLKDILSCYDRQYHKQVISNYLRANKINFNDTIKGRLFFLLWDWKIK